MQNLRSEYASELPGHISDIYKYWQQILRNPDDQESFDKLLRICHNLSGTGASLGFGLLSQHTREIEHFLRPEKNISHNVDSQNLFDISNLINKLDADCKQA